MRSVVVCLSMLSMAATGCIAEEVASSVEEASCGLYQEPDRKLNGSEGLAALEGVCSDDTCNAEKPLAVGSHHRFRLGIETSKFEGKERKGIQLVSEDQNVVDAVDIEVEVHDDEVDPDTGEPTHRDAVELKGEIRAKKAGKTRLVLKQGNTVLDSYELVLADIEDAHVELLEDDVSGDDLGGRGLELSVGGLDAKVSAVATAKDGRKLVLSNANVEWTVEDPEIVELDARPYSQPCGVHGPGAELSGLAAGSTQVSVEVGELEETIAVTVRQ